MKFRNPPQGVVNAIMWAKGVMNGELSVIVFDTETTGFTSNDEIIQMSIVTLDERVLYDGFFYPEVEIDPGAEKVHGINRKNLEPHPVFRDEWKKISPWFENSYVIAYNLEFDIRMLHQTLSRYHLPYPTIEKSKCAMNEMMYIARQKGRGGKFKWIKLKNAIEFLNIDTTDLDGNYHDSSVDAKLTARLVREIASIEFE